MQVQAFATGGFVVHKITGITPSKISAWFDVDGRLLSAEFPDLHRAVHAESATWDAVQRIGLRMAGTHTMAAMVADARDRLASVARDAALAEQARAADAAAHA